MNWSKLESNLNTTLNGSGRQTRITTTAKPIIIALLILAVYASALDLVYSTATQEEDEKGIGTTTSCLGIGSVSESEADAQLLSDGNNISQQCEQIISSADGDDSSRSKNYGTNEVTVDGERTEGSSIQVNQQSKQKIDD